MGWGFTSHTCRRSSNRHSFVYGRRRQKTRKPKAANEAQKHLREKKTRLSSRGGYSRGSRTDGLLLSRSFFLSTISIE